MRRYYKSISYSICFHFLLLILIIAFANNQPVFKKQTKIKFDLINTTDNSFIDKQILKPLKHVIDQHSNLRPAAQKVPAPSINNEVIIDQSANSMTALEMLKDRASIRNFLLQKNTVPLNKDSVLIAQSVMWNKEISQLSITAPVDEVDQMIKKQNGEANIAKMTGMPTNIVKVRKPKFDFIPTEDQIRALSWLFEQGEGTQIDIYPTIKTDTPITARGFDRSMEKLTNKGFITREKVSPQNHLNLVTPIGGIEIEMSAKNRRNPVFNYTLNVKKKQVLAFLDSQILLLQEKGQQARTDSTRINKQIAALQSKIDILRNNFQ
ncbi:hypothetical protein KAR48_18935 [bacterium]|nr:hypothetical protein [bacterium]